MAQIKLLVAFVFVGAAGFAFYLANYLGAFKPVDISQESKEELYLLSLPHFGAYHKIVPVIETVESWAKSNHIDCSLSFGEYFDNPDKVEESRLTSRGGCLWTQRPKLPNPLPEGFQLDILPARNYVVAKFEGSPGIGPMKVYPKVENYISETRLKNVGAPLEVYQVKSAKEMSTTYLFPVE